MITLAPLDSQAPGGHFRMTCVQFAWLRPQHGIALVSVAGPQTAVKSLMAALNQNVKLEVRLDVPPPDEPGDNEPDGTTVPHGVDFVRVGHPGSYQIRTHRLGYHYVHATALLKQPGLLPCITPESVWQLLSGGRFTTPLLRDWVPWLMSQMQEQEQLVRLPAFQCQPGLVEIDDAALDELVSRGLRSGAIAIPRKEGSTPCNS